MLDLIMTHIAELLVGAASTAALALWTHIMLVFKKNDAKLHEFVAIPKDLKTVCSNLETTKNRLTSMQATLSDLHLEMKARGDLNIDAAEFTCNPEGEITHVNQTFARWLGVGKLELHGFGWLNYIHPEDRARVRAEWESCINDHRTYNVRYRLVDTDGEVSAVHAIATPIPDAPPARQWVGVIRKDTPQHVS